MPDGFANDAFQWKNSAHKESSIGLGARLDVTNRDVKHTRDYLQRTLEDDMRGKVRESVCMYADHFNTSISITHRAEIREAACKLFDRACEELLDKYTCHEEEIANAERIKLENRLCELRPELNSIAGSTRNCFSASVIAHALHENNVAITGLLAQLRHDAITRETAALEQAFDRKFLAFIDADDRDFNKYMTAFQILKGSWNKIDFEDDIDEDIVNFTLTAQYNRSAGSISDTKGEYDGDIGAIDSAGGGLAVPAP